MRKRVKVFVVLATLAVCLLSLTGVAAALSFSADVVSFDNGQTMTMKFWMTTAGGSKIRTEMVQDGMAMATIMRMDKMVIWMLMLKEKMYMEYVINPTSPQYQRSQVATAEPTPDETTRVWILNEVVNTYKSDKYRIDYRNQPSHYVWMSGDPGIMMEVKSAALDNKWWREYRNISLAEPDAALFEIPAGFTKMDMKGMMNFGR
ncbi:MAG TPA: hypothetical protein VN521_05900 [Negativicutes bacterium]|nr:hypothetical protein [Negativicutes bacterium]